MSKSKTKIGTNRFYRRRFDDYDAIINGDNINYRLTIFQRVKSKIKYAIAYQADASGVKGFIKLKKQIDEFRYGFTENLFDQL